MVVLNATVRDEANVLMSPAPNAAKPGPIGINVPISPKVGPIRVMMSVFCKLFEFEEEKTMSNLQKTDIITRIGPTLGLMGTLIPMGPGLAALGAGDINTLASSLTVAFNTTIVGIGSGALCYVIGKIRSGWYDRYLSDLDALIDAVLDYMNRQ